MDAQTRHALKQNELGELLQNLRGSVGTPEFRRWALIIVLVVLAVVSWRVWRWNSVTADQVAWAQLLNPPRADSDAELLAHFREHAARHTRGNVGAAARIMLADSLVVEAYRDLAKKDTPLNEAADALRAVLADSGVAAYHGAALFKLAAICESLGKYDEARKSYETLTGYARFAASPYRAAAQTRFDSLDAISRPVTFLPGTQPAPAELPSMSEIGPAPAPAPEATPADTPAAEAPAPQADAAPTQPEGDAAPAQPDDQAPPPASDEAAAGAGEQPAAPPAP
jgi:predicted negative regulator of RcsB-dependent stress response